MKKYAIMLFLGVLAISVWVYRHKQPLQSQTKRISKSGKELARLPVKVMPSAISKASGEEENLVPLACKTVWSILQQKLNKSILENKEVFNEECFNLSKNLEITKDVLVACFKKDLSNEKNRETCLSALSIYRAYVIFQLTKNEDVSKLDSTILMNQIMAIANGATGHPDRKGFVNLMEPRVLALQEKEPDLYTGYKAAAWVDITKVFVDPDADPSEKTRLTRTALNSIAEAEKFNVRDDELAATSWNLNLANNNIEAAEAQVDDYLQHYPDSALAIYFKSSLLWKGGDLEGAVNDLNEAIRLDPNSQTFKGTLAKIRAGKTGDAIDPIYNYGFNLKFDELQ